MKFTAGQGNSVLYSVSVCKCSSGFPVSKSKSGTDKTRWHQKCVDMKSLWRTLLEFKVSVMIYHVRCSKYKLFDYCKRAF